MTILIIVYYRLTVLYLLCLAHSCIVCGLAPPVGPIPENWWHLTAHSHWWPGVVEWLLPQYCLVFLYWNYWPYVIVGDSVLTSRLLMELIVELLIIVDIVAPIVLAFPTYSCCGSSIIVKARVLVVTEVLLLWWSVVLRYWLIVLLLWLLVLLTPFPGLILPLCCWVFITLIVVIVFVTHTFILIPLWCCYLFNPIVILLWHCCPWLLLLLYTLLPIVVPICW